MGRPKKVEKISEFISSGSTLLDLALSGKVGGGWRLGRICNIVGDKSTGKTLLAIEAATYVLKMLGKKEDVKVIYDETEAAFDLPYAESLGMPINDVEFRNTVTVEEFFNELDKLLKQDDYGSLLYIMDSLDGLSSIQEMKAKIEDGSYSMSKQKKLGELFRKLVGKMRNKNITLMIISQVRDNIGVMFGPKQRRSGGKALDFYASQVVWLANKGKLGEADRTVGVNIKAKVDKNKIWKPYREATFPILFEYGVDDVGAMVDFLIEKTAIKKEGHSFLWKDEKYKREELIVMLEDCKEEVVKLTEDTWNELEEKCKVVRKPKY
jgi:recombination protein RecA